ncbi:uncharacterized protein LOC128549293 [Mercenaria mercenaria]|uniref:uncharacterized protein LOC128549293 n=1 Tax=Mercenaria mercenaria TaxID=6596 RepID=UPI00234FAC32|nr:uncharacterized protein LOC128549293 [Mercenaria mercenaria]
MTLHSCYFEYEHTSSRDEYKRSEKLSSYLEAIFERRQNREDIIITLSLLLLSLATLVLRHGRLINPPSRSFAFRQDFNTPLNDMDHQLNCGGSWNQWGVNNGHCGVCGDPYQGPRENEAGGKYATGTIVRHYKESQQINVEIEITEANGGWSEFRLCPNNDVHKVVTQQCLDRYLLPTPSGETRIEHQGIVGIMRTPLVLPPGLTCTQCVFQWKSNTAHDSNCDPVTHECCMGCGPQEQFYGCADISIGHISNTGSSFEYLTDTSDFLIIDTYNFIKAKMNRASIVLRINAK